MTVDLKRIMDIWTKLWSSNGMPKLWTVIMCRLDYQTVVLLLQRNIYIYRAISMIDKHRVYLYRTCARRLRYSWSSKITMELWWRDAIMNLAAFLYIEIEILMQLLQMSYLRMNRSGLSEWNGIIRWLSDSMPHICSTWSNTLWCFNAYDK